MRSAVRRFLFLSGAFWTAAPVPAPAQIDTGGSFPFPVGADFSDLGLSGISGVNRTSRRIHGFGFELGDACGVAMVRIEMSSTQPTGAGDWDVDDDEDGASNEIPVDLLETEQDNVDGTPGRSARVDSNGKGREPGDEGAHGKPIGQDMDFRIRVAFDSATRQACELVVSPQDFRGLPLAALRDGLRAGPNPVTVPGDGGLPGVATGGSNATGAVLEAVRVDAPAGVRIARILEVDAASDGILSERDCGLADSCTIDLSRPAAAGAAFALDVVLDRMAAGPTTTVTITPVPPAPRCPREGDSHALELAVDPSGGQPGRFIAQAQGFDEGDEPLYYTFMAESRLYTLRLGPQRDPSAELDLVEGDWRVSVSVDDDLSCGDEAPDATLSVDVSVVQAAGGGQVPGDANQDQGLDLSDAVFLLGHLFNGSPARVPCAGGTVADPGNVVLLDSNGDGGVDLSDAVYDLNYLFSGSAPPVLGVICRRIEGCPALCAAAQDPNDPGLLTRVPFQFAKCGESGDLYTNTTGADIEVFVSVSTSGDCDLVIASGAAQFTVPKQAGNTHNYALKVARGASIKFECRGNVEGGCTFFYEIRMLGAGRGGGDPALGTQLYGSWYLNRKCGESGELFTNKLDRTVDLVLTLNNIGECEVTTMAGSQPVSLKAGQAMSATAVRFQPGDSWKYKCAALTDKTCQFFWSLREMDLSASGSGVQEPNLVGSLLVDEKCSATGVLFTNNLPAQLQLSVKVVTQGDCPVTIKLAGGGEILTASKPPGTASGESSSTTVEVPSGGQIEYSCAAAAGLNQCKFLCILRVVPSTAKTDGLIALGGLQDATVKNCGTAQGTIFVNKLAADLKVEVILANSGFHCPVRVFLNGAEELKADPGKSSGPKTITVPKNGGSLTYVCGPGSAEGPCLFLYFVKTQIVE